MSDYIFKLPDLGEGTVESEIGEWFIKVGDRVAEEDVVGTMMTDKAAVELSSPVSGKVVKLGGEPGDIVAVGAALFVAGKTVLEALNNQVFTSIRGMPAGRRWAKQRHIGCAHGSCQMSRSRIRTHAGCCRFQYGRHFNQ